VDFFIQIRRCGQGFDEGVRVPGRQRYGAVRNQNRVSKGIWVRFPPSALMDVKTTQIRQIGWLFIIQSDVY
jgi:hypothetical protein